jgi:hypothetical protein
MSNNRIFKLQMSQKVVTTASWTKDRLVEYYDTYHLIDGIDIGAPPPIDEWDDWCFRILKWLATNRPETLQVSQSDSPEGHKATFDSKPVDCHVDYRWVDEEEVPS